MFGGYHRQKIDIEHSSGQSDLDQLDEHHKLVSK